MSVCFTKETSLEVLGFVFNLINEFNTCPLDCSFYTLAKGRWLACQKELLTNWLINYLHPYAMRFTWK